MESTVKIAAEGEIDPFNLIEELRCSLEAKDHQIKLLEEKINYLLHHRFGSKSERFDERQQLLFDNEDATCEVASTAEIEVPAHTRKKGGRRIPPKDLPRVRVEHDLPEASKQCTCGHCLTRIGEETSFQYDVIPAKFQVLEHVKLKYACSNPKCDQPPKTAQQNPPPPSPLWQRQETGFSWQPTRY